MARVECPCEADVLAMVYTGRWPERAPAELRVHAAQCRVCADVATVAAAIDEETAERFAPRLPGSGMVWWRAQMRARQEAAREVVRPITVAQTVAVAVLVGIAGAVFGATAQWFQRALARLVDGTIDMVSRVALPSLPAWSPDSPALLAGHGAALIAVALVVGMTAVAVSWVLKED